MNNPYENKVLLSEVKRTLDDEVESLDFPIQSRLTQARFHAIDKGLFSSPLGDYRQHALKGLTVVCVFALAIVFGINLYPIHSFVNHGHYNSSLESPAAVLPLFDDGIDTDRGAGIDRQEVKTVKTSEEVPEDTREEIEIYNWLYEQYG